ncbi:MAG: hypothetical protein ABIK36_16965 [Pseudomonadota bacterium]
MSWKAKTGREQKVLVSIVSTLLALADLAERAAGRSPWVRWCVLWAAWQADLIARDYVAGSTWNEAGRHWSPVLPMVRYGTHPADALDIAASLRALAQMVRTLAAKLGRLSRIRQEQAAAWSACRDRPLHDIARLLSDAPSFRLERFDTS